MIDTLAKNIGNYLPLVANNRNLFKETIFTENIGTCIKAMKSLILDQPDMDMKKRIDTFNRISVFVKLKGRSTDIEDILEALDRRFDQYGKQLLIDETDLKPLEDALDLLDAVRLDGFEPKLTTLQDAVWNMKENISDPVLKVRIAKSLNLMPL
jgi:hypothetical protein